MANDTVKVRIAFDPEDRSREGQEIELDSAEAHSLVWNGRAAYVDEDKKTAKKSTSASSGNATAGS